MAFNTYLSVVAVKIDERENIAFDDTALALVLCLLLLVIRLDVFKKTFPFLPVLQRIRDRLARLFGSEWIVITKTKRRRMLVGDVADLHKNLPPRLLPGDGELLHFAIDNDLEPNLFWKVHCTDTISKPLPMAA